MKAKTGTPYFPGKLSAISRFILVSGFLFLTVLDSRGQSGNLIRARVSCQEGIAALERADPYSAIENFSNALSSNPAYLEARLGLVEALFRLGEYQRASSEIESARKYNSESRALHLLHARILVARGYYDEATRMYNDLLKVKPHDVQANRGLAEIYALTGKRELALRFFDISLSYSPNDRRSLLQKILLLDDGRERDKAGKVLEEVLALYPEDISVRLGAIEHYSLYGEWEQALSHVAEAGQIIVNVNDPRYLRIAMLESRILLEMGDAVTALSVLEGLKIGDSEHLLYLMARAYRFMGAEDKAQNVLGRLIRENQDDEIIRMYRDEYFINHSGGFEVERLEASQWYLNRGLKYEENFYYERAFDDFRRARLIYNSNPDIWIAYTNNLYKRGYIDNYSDSLEVALQDISPIHPEYGNLREKLLLQRHSSSSSLAENWSIDNPWIIDRSEWKLGVFLLNGTHLLDDHPGAETTLSGYLADILDKDPNIALPADGRNLLIYREMNFPMAFKRARDSLDYFLIINFGESSSRFEASASLFIGRTGEKIASRHSSRKGSNRVSAALHDIARFVVSTVPGRMSVVATDNEKVLLDKGSWHNVEIGSTWVALKAGAERPALNSEGITFSGNQYLGTVEVTNVSEPLSEGSYSRESQFDYISPGVQLFLVPDSVEIDPLSQGNSRIRTQILAVP